MPEPAAEETSEPNRIPTKFRSLRRAPACDPDRVTTVVITGQFTSAHESFGITLAGGYGALTDSRGYFEVRIPREDFLGDPCALSSEDSFDGQVTLRYRLEFDR